MNEADTDIQTIQEAYQALSMIDVQYKLADPADQPALKDKRDQAFSAYSLARLHLLESQVTTTRNDLRKMKRIKAEVESAADTQALLAAMVKFAVFMARLAV